ncbi:MAG: hypothetical protein RIM84_19630 [Alphaproteobacteria bacterium]
MPVPEPDLIARLAKDWYGLELDTADAEGLAAALAPVEAVMRLETNKLGFDDMNLARFAASLERLAREPADD